MKHWMMPLLLVAPLDAPAALPTPTEATWITAHSDRNPAISPDATTLVFTSDRSGRQALYLRRVPEGPVSALVDDGTEPGYAAWSPDGRQIAFTAQVRGQDDIFVINADGSGRRHLVAHPARDGHPRWSPDGERVYFNSERPLEEPRTAEVTAPEGEDRVDIYSVRADGTDLRRHSNCGSECSYPSVSPDGRSLLFRRVFWGPAVDADGKPVRNSEIVVTKLDGSSEVNLLDSPAYDVYPIWSHDGEWIYFSSNREGQPTQLHLWRVPSKGGMPERLTTGIWSHRQASPSNDGKLVYVFTYLRTGGTDVGYVGKVDVPR